MIALAFSGYEPQCFSVIEHIMKNDPAKTKIVFGFPGKVGNDQLISVYLVRHDTFNGFPPGLFDYIVSWPVHWILREKRVLDVVFPGFEPELKIWERLI
ncbi:hypothetical protein JCM14469_13470 [Desulfatiferula olefinivorans]